MANYSVQKLSGTSCVVTGSIAKVLALDSAGSCSFQFGNFSLPATQFTPTSTVEDVSVADGTYIEGPMGSFSGSNYLVYLNQMTSQQTVTWTENKGKTN